MKVFVVVPEATVTEAGTVATPVLPLERVTTFPPVGAFALSVTVPVEVVPPVTLVGLSVTVERFWAAPGRARRVAATSSGRRPDAKRAGFKGRSSSERRAAPCGNVMRMRSLLRAQRSGSMTRSASSMARLREVKKIPGREWNWGDRIRPILAYPAIHSLPVGKKSLSISEQVLDGAHHEFNRWNR